MSSAAGSQAYVKMIATERRAVGALALVLAFRMFGLFVLLPVLALYASDLPGATPILAGLAEALQNGQGNDRIAITGTSIERGVTYRLEVEEGVLQLIGQAAKLQNARGRDPF